MVQKNKKMINASKDKKKAIKKSGYVAIIGRPNAGKSTLLNCIMGKKISIISDKPQTTRRRILAVLTDENTQIVFFDTPGVHKPGYDLNRRMVQHIYDALESADVVLHIIDVSQPYGHGEEFVLNIVKQASRPAILLLNKIDIVKKSKILERISFYKEKHDYAAYIPISAKYGDGIEEMLDELYTLLPEGDFFYDSDFVTDLSQRFLIAETIREKVLIHTRKELPYTTTVYINMIDDSNLVNRNLMKIEASIVVERQSQKAIVIGKNGSMLKKIGTEARKDIEKMLGCKVYLGLFVKVMQKWRNNLRFLNQLEREM